jgi:hypothetical protein
MRVAEAEALVESVEMQVLHKVAQAVLARHHQLQAHR